MTEGLPPATRRNEDERVTSVANLAGALDVRDAAAVEVVVSDTR